jgi:hypothetical protein
MISIKLPDETDDLVAAEVIASLKIFNFTVPLDVMDAETKSVYYRLRRVALTAASGEYLVQHGQGDADLLPDGKVYTEAQVIEILGPDYATGVVTNQKCCN